MYLNQIAKYWDTRAQGYSDSIHKQLENEERDFFRNILRDGAPKGESLKCLDIGCGPGFFSILLAKDGHCVTAVDYSEGMLEQARNNFEEAGVSVITTQGDAQKLPFASGSFDYIVSRNLVWNLEQPERTYREWIRLLKPSGRLLVADGNHYLYYYDNTYSEAMKADVAERHELDGVDPTPINDIARDLPLSKEHRPEWDVNTLISLGMERIDVQVSRKQFVDDKNGEIKSVVSDFIVIADKPAGDIL